MKYIYSHRRKILRKKSQDEIRKKVDVTLAIIGLENQAI